MQHRTPSGQGRSRGRVERARKHQRSGRHMLGANSRSRHHAALDVGTQRGGGGRAYAHPTLEPDSTCREPAAGSRTTPPKHQEGEAAITHQNKPPCTGSEQPTPDMAAVALLPPSKHRVHFATAAPHFSPVDRHTRGGQRPCCRLPLLVVDSSAARGSAQGGNSC
jgi:hypothetical protein